LGAFVLALDLTEGLTRAMIAVGMACAGLVSRGGISASAVGSASSVGAASLALAAKALPLNLSRAHPRGRAARKRQEGDRRLPAEAGMSWLRRHPV